MPWQEVSIMEQREEFVRLARLEGVNRRELCRRFGISAQTGYKWLHRFAAGEALEDRSRRPKSSPRRVERSLEEAVIGVRKAHPAWGARKIAAVLARSHESLPAVSTIHAVLCRHGLVVPREATGQVWNRFEQDAANRLWQMDFKGRVRLGDAQPCHPLTIVDDHSRFAVCLAACLDQRTRTVQHQLERSFARYGLPDAFLVDNGSPWGSSHPDSRWTPLRVWLARLGVNMIYARPFHPQTKGKNERFNRTLNEEVLALRSNRHSTAGGSSTTIIARMRRWPIRCRQAATGRRNGTGPTACPTSPTNPAPSPGWCPEPRLTSATRAGCGRCRKPSADTASPSGQRQPTASSASTSPQTGSQTSTLQPYNPVSYVSEHPSTISQVCTSSRRMT
jgi:transposase InsO family protein